MPSAPWPKGERLDLRLSGPGFDWSDGFTDLAPRGARFLTTDDAPVYGPALDASGLDRQQCAVPKRTARGHVWTEANLRAFARRHSFSRDALQNLEPLVVTIDEPGLFEMARADVAGVLSVKDGMRNARVISRYIEKGSMENKVRLWQAIQDDSAVRAEVLCFAPLMLDHPWAVEDYQGFLDHACAVDAAGD